MLVEKTTDRKPTNVGCHSRVGKESTPNKTEDRGRKRTQYKEHKSRARISPMLNTREFEDSVQGTQVKSKNLSDVKHQSLRTRYKEHKSRARISPMLNTREFENAVQGTQVKSRNLSDVKHQRVQRKNIGSSVRKVREVTYEDANMLVEKTTT